MEDSGGLLKKWLLLGRPVLGDILPSVRSDVDALPHNQNKTVLCHLGERLVLL